MGQAVADGDWVLVGHGFPNLGGNWVTEAVDAATNTQITAQDLLRLGVIDGIIPEPFGGAHRDGVEVVKAAGEVISEALATFDPLTPDQIRKERREKFLAMGRPA